MMKNILIFLIVCSCCIGCNKTTSEQICTTYEEMADPATLDSTAWNTLTPNLYASWGSIDVRYPKSEIPTISGQTLWQGIAWRGERLSAQLVLWSAGSEQQVECSFEDFISGDNKLPADIAQARFVKYVMTDVFGPGCGYRKPEDFPSSLSPDALDNVSCYNIPSNTVRPVWVTIDIPANARPGIYTSRMKIAASGKEKYTFDMQLEVLDRTLPPPSEWAFHLDLWQHPAAVARYYQVPVWSDEHFEYMRPLMKKLADTGQKVITATLNKDPWGQCYDNYKDMILWTKKEDGSWSYDYSIFDRWITFMMEMGVTNMINCYSMVPWNNELHYKNELSGKMDTVQAVPGTLVFKEMWEPFLKDFATHLKEKGWLEITNMAMDERSPEVMNATIGLLQQTAPSLGISIADNHKSYKKFTFIKDLCISFGAVLDPEDLKYRKEKGFITTYYVCCSHPFPNMFTFSSPAESVYAAWYASAAGLDGFLRWAYNSWVENPLTDSRFRTWPAGDTYLIYPDARSSIRLERIREGIQDVEKIRILKAEWQKENTPESQVKLQQLDQELSKFNIPAQPEQPAADILNAAKLLLNDLSR